MVFIYLHLRKHEMEKVHKPFQELTKLRVVQTYIEATVFSYDTDHMFLACRIDGHVF
jgi:hypothetical protein